VRDAVEEALDAVAKLNGRTTVTFLRGVKPLRDRVPRSLNLAFAIAAFDGMLLYVLLVLFMLCLLLLLFLLLWLL